MTTKVESIIHKYHSLLNADPLPGEIEFGEIGLNINNTAPFIAFKLSDGTIHRISTSGALTGSAYTVGADTLLGRTTAGSGPVEELTVGSNLTLASGTLSAASANLGITGRTNTELQITSSTGAGITLPEATNSQSGLLSGTLRAKLNIAPVSDTSGIVGATQVTNIVKISQADYDNIPSPDPNTLYFITA